MPPRPEAILGLEWSPEAEEHIERHIDAWQIDEMLEGGDFFTFRNVEGHPPRRWRLIGRTPAGIFITAVLEEPRDGDPTKWRPVTGRRSEPFEQGMYRSERERLGKKQGRKRG